MNLSKINISFLFFGIIGFLLVLISVYCLTIAIFKSIKNRKLLFNQNIFLLTISWIQLLTIEYIQKNNSFHIQSIILTIIFLFLINFCLSLFKNKYKLLLIVFSSILLIYSISERYVILFRGEPYSISDLGAISTAISVSNKYNFTPTKEMIISIIINLLMYIFIVKVNIIRNDKIKNICVFITFILFTSFITFISLDKESLDLIFDVKGWNKTLAIQRNGCIGNLYIDILFSRFEYPEDYDEEYVEETLNDIKTESIEEKNKAVNIICILEESFYDLNIIEDLELNKDNLEYYHSLDENTIKGYTVVSAFGGGTANSEYEFLTNGNMFFLPKNVYPFTKYINGETFSLASALKDLNYETIAFHPFSKTSWDRQKVYPLLGFDEYYALEDLPELENNQNNFLRGTISDESNMKEIINLYENKEKDSKLFIYNVTIQNHSGYEEDFGLNEIYSKKYNNLALNQYLSLIKKSDDSIKELIEYFDNVDEPTLICIFGDHIPGTIEDILHCSPDFLSGDEKLTRYKTPFLIHTNYDIDETYYENISLSYLSTLVMDYANLPKTKEQTFVQSFMDNYPILNEWGYKFEDTWYDSDSLNDYLKKYRDFTYYELRP